MERGGCCRRGGGLEGNLLYSTFAQCIQKLDNKEEGLNTMCLRADPLDNACIGLMHEGVVSAEESTQMLL